MMFMNFSSIANLKTIGVYNRCIINRISKSAVMNLPYKAALNEKGGTL